MDSTVFKVELAQPIENDDFRCEICDKLFKNNKNKKQHIRSVHGEEMNFASQKLSLRTKKLHM